jgi:hypothetical protein
MAGARFCADLICRCLQILFQWIRNNWRLPKRVGVDPTKKKVSRIQVVWRLWKDEVEERMAELHEAEDGGRGFDNKAKLRLWPTAAADVYRNLSDEEKAEVGREVDRIAADGNPPDLQRKRADKYGAAKVKQWSEERWKDMGMLSVTFYVYRNRKGNVRVGG